MDNIITGSTAKDVKRFKGIEDEKDQWWDLVEMIVGAGDLAFHSSTKVEDATGLPQLVVFWDGSNSAFSCTIYTRWPLGSGGYSVRLLAAKAKVALKLQGLSLMGPNSA